MYIRLAQRLCQRRRLPLTDAKRAPTAWRDSHAVGARLELCGSCRDESRPANPSAQRSWGSLDQRGHRRDPGCGICRLCKFVQSIQCLSTLPIYSNTAESFADRGGHHSTEIPLGWMRWEGEEAVSHLQTHFIHETGNPYAAHEDGRVIMLGTVTRELSFVEDASLFLRWLQDGPKSLDWFLAQIRTVNRNAVVQQGLQAIGRGTTSDRIPCVGRTGCTSWSTSWHEGTQLWEEPDDFHQRWAGLP